MMATLSFTDNHLHRLASFIAENIDLLKTHPNDADVSILPESWQASAEQLAIYYARKEGGDALPESLRKFIDSVRELELPRRPIDMQGMLLDLPSKKGMSPKKYHEVHRMASYVKALVGSMQDKCPGIAGSLDQLYIVDVGAGQGYLTRALGNFFPSAKLLALDADHSQTEGAERFVKPSKPGRIDPQTSELESRISHRTILITPETLLQVVDDWVDGQSEDRDGTPVSVIFVALHACGSLTPDLLRSFLSRVSDSDSVQRIWKPLSVVAVGCCYNLMFPGDYPLSRTLQAFPPASQSLPTAAYHLAAQIPMTWVEKDLKSGDWKLQSAVQMAIRKIVWRALLQFALATAHEAPPRVTADTEGNRRTRSADVPVKWWTVTQQGSKPSHALWSSPAPREKSPSAAPPSFDRLVKVKEATIPTEQRHQGEGITDAGMRLGRLYQSAYMHGWEHFLKIAGERLGVCWVDEEADSLRNPTLEKKIEVLHTLRCLLGSIVETAILLDRLQWIREELERCGHCGENESSMDKHSWNVDLVNLFDQELGSGRNVAVVIAPIIPACQ
ncbi:hypothetical protein NMY22_g11237 [Coprinellus aureogranulatus]|nr:hypothetical protein NMY22_g11237 [Coprinellus aureogranulatus]